MALINLNLINKLESQADVGRSFAESCCYNNSEESQVTPDLFMSCIKRAMQADALFKHLVELYKKSKDFAAGNFQPHIDEYNSYRESEEDPDFDPFDELYYHFDSGMISDLPKTIEQYSELLELLHNFGEYREKLDQGFTEFFGDTLTTYHVVDVEGEPELVPRHELPEDMINQMDANRQIEGISIEYCLDGYNEFYRQCLGLINSHRQQGTIHECAKAILALYVPYAHA